MPSNWGGVLIFLLLVAPGLLFDLRSARRRASPKQSAFREIGRITLASIGFGAAALVVVLIAAARWPGVFAGPPDVLESHSPTSDVGAVKIAWTLGLQTAVALALAFLWSFGWEKRQSSDLRPVSSWTKAFRTGRPEGSAAYARVKLRSGSVWVGQVESFSADLETPGRELVLIPPISVAAPGQPLAPLPASWQRVLIAGDDIESIAVQYAVFHEPSSEPAT